jgi:hypothetical protein
MSRLKLYWPDAQDSISTSVASVPTEEHRIVASEEPQAVQFPFASLAARMRGPGLVDIICRARKIHQNQCCQFCRSAAVDPVELQDALLNRNRLPIPGTATLVGFHCNACGYEWPA